VSLLYTIVPPEEIWEEEAPGEATGLMAVTYRGVPLLARRTPQGAVIERLLTTDPDTYLNPGFSPGTLLAGTMPEA
jgi:hypothetical protein